ncbi:MAG TPA: hypothetical protein VHG91_18460 [Longimicrobium sp.]|nr:hypothetical protein [Longimicrobium sp.]
MLKKTIAALCLAGAAALPAAAQEITIEPGDEVRVVAPARAPHRIQGEVLLYRGDSLAVREDGTGTVYEMPLADVRRLSKNVGLDRGRSIRHSVRFGLFLGTAVGAIAGPLIASRDRDPDHFYPILGASTASGVLLGAGIGAAHGAFFAGDRWQAFRMPPVQAGVTRDGGAVVAVSLRAP